jgi:hypothetical protein
VCAKVTDSMRCDAGGVLPFETLEELGSILDSISPSLYESLREFAIKNYHLATGTGASSAHVIWEGGIKQLVESLPSVAIFRPVNNNILDEFPCLIFSPLTVCPTVSSSAVFLAPSLEASRTLGARR